MDRSSLQASLASMRLPFLTLPLVCVALGAAVASFQGYVVDPTLLALVLLGAEAAHVGVNALNEYDDFRSGLDFHTRRTPFSGGSGFLPAAPHKAHVALVTGVGGALLSAALGVYFVHLRGAGLWPLGVLGLFIVVVYTRWLTRAPISCLIAPGLGFGPLMVMGTEFVLTGRYSAVGLVASLVPFFLVSDLLLLNQFPDVEADRQIGRRHLPIVIGRRASAWVYVLFLGLTYGLVIAGWTWRVLPSTALFSLLTVILAVPTAAGVVRHAEDFAELVPRMGKNVLIVLLTPALLAAGLVLGKSA